MSRNDVELEVTLERIGRFQQQMAHLCRTVINPVDYRLSVAGFLAEIDRMNLEVRDYLSFHPREAELMGVGRPSNTGLHTLALTRWRGCGLAGIFGKS